MCISLMEGQFKIIKITLDLAFIIFSCHENLTLIIAFNNTFWNGKEEKMPQNANRYIDLFLTIKLVW